MSSDRTPFDDPPGGIKVICNHCRPPGPVVLTIGDVSACLMLLEQQIHNVVEVLNRFDRDLSVTVPLEDPRHK